MYSLENSKEYPLISGLPIDHKTQFYKSKFNLIAILNSKFREFAISELVFQLVLKIANSKEESDGYLPLER